MEETILMDFVSSISHVQCTANVLPDTAISM